MNFSRKRSLLFIIITCIALSSSMTAEAKGNIFSGLWKGLKSLLSEVIVKPIGGLMTDTANYVLKPILATPKSQAKTNAQLASSTQYQNAHTAASAEQGKTLNKQLSGNTDTFQNQVTAYKQPTQVCEKGKNGKCYSTLNSHTLYLNKQLNPTQTKASHLYTQNASGAISGISKPLPANQEKPNIQAIKYHTYYKQQASITSAQANHHANARAGRVTAKNSSKSPDAFMQDITRDTIVAKEIIEDLEKIPPISWAVKIVNASISTSMSLMKTVESLGGMGTMLAGILNIGHSGMHLTQGRILKHNYDMSQTGQPNKKMPHG